MTGFVVPKFKFGTEYISDFLVADWRQRWCITLIELEPKDVKAFNQDGTPARRLSQAIKQLAEWNQWIKGHSGYFAERLAPHGEKLISHWNQERGGTVVSHTISETSGICTRKTSRYLDEGAMTSPTSKNGEQRCRSLPATISRYLVMIGCLI